VTADDARQNRPARTSSILRRLAFGVGLTLLLSEISLRFVLGNMGQVHIIVPSHHREVCIELSAGSEAHYTGWFRRIDSTWMRVNSHGARGAEFARDKTDGTFRVIALGDSFTFGQGVEEEHALPVQIGDALGTLGHPVEVLNFGVPGHSASRSVAMLELNLLDLDADLVVLHVFNNDLEPEESTCPWFHEEPEKRDDKGLIGRLKDFTDSQFYTIRAFGILRRTLGGRGPRVSRPRPPNSSTRHASAARGGPPSQDDHRASQERFVAALRRLRQLSQEHDFLAAVVLLTDARSFCRGPGSDCVSAHSLIASTPAGTLPPVLDMTSAWDVLHGREGSFIEGEGHFTIAGNRLMGSMIGSKLLSWPELVQRASPSPPP
jgi:lysophospholipase L1-like esterase